MPLQIRRGTQADRDALVAGNVPLAAGEPLWTIDEGKLYVGDGTTPGGVVVNLTEDIDLASYIGQIGGIEKDPIGDPGTKSPFITLDETGVTIDLDKQISTNITPNDNDLFNLGENDLRFRQLFLGNNGIVIGEASITSTGTLINLPAGSKVGGVEISTYTGDGSEGGTGIVEGGTYAISIASNDSTVIVDHVTSIFTGTFNGDLTGDVTGDVTGNVTGDVNGTLNGTVYGNIKNSLDELVLDVENKSINIEEINIGGAGIINGNSIFLANVTSFVSSTPSLTEPTLTAAVISSSSNTGGSLSLTRARGTIAGGETSVINGDEIGSLEFGAHNGSGFVSVGNIVASVNGIVTAGQPAPIKVDVNLSNGSTVVNVATFKPSQVEFAVAPVMPNLTSTEITALTPTVGMIVYNTTTNKFQGYQNTGGVTPEWVDIS